MEAEKPLVTIILTLYQIAPAYVRECINSIQNQTLKSFRIIAIDDCSPSIDYSWLEGMKHVTYIRNGRNLGLCRSVNKVFSLVNTKYTLRLGSDDYFSEDLLYKEVGFLEKNPDYIAVCCNLQRFGARNNVLYRPEEWTLEHKKDLPPRENVAQYSGYGYGGGMLFRSSVLDKCRLPETYMMCEDFDFHLQLLEHGKIHSIHEVLYFYRSHSDNMTKKLSPAQKKDILYEMLKAHGLA